MTDLIAKLSGVRKGASEGQWIARCPAHEDKSPSLSVKLADDGRWLVYCFAGCTALDVCRALGLELRDLFRDGYIRRNESRHKHALTATERLELIEHEVTVAMLIGSDFVNERELSEENWQRLFQATERISRARYV